MSLAPGRRPLPAASERPRDLSAPLPASLSWGVLIAFTAAFALAYLILGLPWWLPALYGAVSILTFAVYGSDKRAARRSTRRVPEDNLLTLGLIGGWPGAVVAQQVFRHKTRKRSFRRAFWGTVVANVLVLAAFLAAATLLGWDLEPEWLANLPELLSQI
ncbi:DUF1294 domain-containing protein [Microbacterium sp. Root180]|uniref:DUF1294 domain-containing protein n=1 Tax=Microbacterium sp. Root180 TaxID=1736483 RepID=UPI00070006ED|nr:DUF1294 domain-containing protein [Microbacterium sp. Root180]KRB37590.1 hypothetical protein ASD93_04390 [Microbacterium sp. Root180]